MISYATTARTETDRDRQRQTETDRDTLLMAYQGQTETDRDRQRYTLALFAHRARSHEIVNSMRSGKVCKYGESQEARLRAGQVRRWQRINRLAVAAQPGLADQTAEPAPVQPPKDKKRSKSV